VEDGFARKTAHGVPRPAADNEMNSHPPQAKIGIAAKRSAAASAG
jgi:hypothetical protein